MKTKRKKGGGREGKSSETFIMDSNYPENHTLGYI